MRCVYPLLALEILHSLVLHQLFPEWKPQSITKLLASYE